jgi:hypothetical protein
MEAKLARLKELIDLKERTDNEIAALLGGSTVKETKARVCSNCHQEGHNVRACPQRSLPLQQ